MSKEEERIFEALLDYLRQSRGFDFTGYKRSTLRRRVTKQMQARGINNFDDYLDYLEVHPKEFEVLFNTILINVTSFKRDAEAWDYLEQYVIPSVLNNKASHEPIRVWSAGCASGEEAYTLAMLLAECLGTDPFCQRVKIYATDVDEDALSQARQATYEAKALNNLPQSLIDKYFEPSGDRYTFRPDLRRAIIFSRHDLVQDAPISRLDLLTCRNTLMYFNAETQARVLARFHFALNPTGVMFLGKAEMLLTHVNLFMPLNLQHRMFTRLSKINLRDRLLVLAQTGDEEASDRLVNHGWLREAAFDAGPVAQIVVGHSSNLVLANQQARSLFKINPQDLGRPLQDLEIAYRPLELRSRIEQVYEERRAIIVNHVVRHLPNHETQYLDVHITPLYENESDCLGVSISFMNVTPYHFLQEELQRSNQDLETANEELQSANEELEITNEELQSTNEELQTTNEELGTMNEELQSTNGELKTINDELRSRTIDLNQANALLSSILSSLQAGVIVVDRQFQILSWNNQAEDLWGLRADEVQQQSLLNLDIGLPVDRLCLPIRNCLTGKSDRLELTLEATNRRGQPIQCRISLTLLIGPEQERQGVILLMEPLGL